MFVNVSILRLWARCRRIESLTNKQRAEPSCGRCALDAQVGSNDQYSRTVALTIGKQESAVIRLRQSAGRTMILKTRWSNEAFAGNSELVVARKKQVAQTRGAWRRQKGTSSCMSGVF